MIPANQREELREVCLTYLARRPSLAFSPDAIDAHIRRRQEVDFQYANGDAVEALGYLEGLGYVARITDQLGPSVKYRVTTAGIQYAEAQGLA